MLEIATALVAGVAIGAASGVPLGVLNSALVEAAARAGARHATGIALGGALADGIHAALAFLGVAPLLLDDPAIARPLALASASIVLAYAVALAWPRSVRPSESAKHPGARHGGFVIGIALTLPNPAPLVAWVAVAAAVLPDASVASGIAAAVGVTIGSAVWFVLLARWAARGALGAGRARWMPRVVAALLVVIAGVGVARTLL